MLCKITRFGNGMPDRSQVVHLPKSEQELNALLCDMQINRENNYACNVSNIKVGNDSLEYHISECGFNIDELNHVAGFIQKLNEQELSKLGTVMSVEKPQDSVTFINHMHNLEEYNLYENAGNYKELGEIVAFSKDGIDSESPLGMCINFEEYGSSYHDAHDGVFINGRYLVPASVPSQEYDGVMLPGSDEFGAQTKLTVQIVSSEKFGMSGDDRGIWVKLPTTEYALNRIAHRLGEPGIECCSVIHANCTNEFIEYIVADNRGEISELNTLAEVMEFHTNPAQMEKFEAVLEYEGDLSLSEIINLAYNLDRYEYDPEIRSVEDFVISRYDNDLVKLAQAGEIDGEKLLARCGGKITENGFVAQNDKMPVQIYDPPRPEQVQEQDMSM